eukprot:9161857-Pyramimonas_sp.AAC.1
MARSPKARPSRRNVYIVVAIVVGLIVLALSTFADPSSILWALSDGRARPVARPPRTADRSSENIVVESEQQSGEQEEPDESDLTSEPEEHVEPDEESKTAEPTDQADEPSEDPGETAEQLEEPAEPEETS